jgi:hypothetical protein
VKVIIRTLTRLRSHSVTLVTETFEHGRWIEAAESAFNEQRGYAGAERRHLIVDSYLGGGHQAPFGLHNVQFARYDPEAKVYQCDEVLRLELTRDG